jgi:hypothetical protein
MRKCTLSSADRGKTIRPIKLFLVAGAALAGISAAVFANAQAPPAREPGAPAPGYVDLNAPNGVAVIGGTLETVEYQGRKAVRLTTQPSTEETFAFIKGALIQDGTIEADIALKKTTPPGVRMPGFVGIAFRASADPLHYDLIYLRPGNSHSEDQAMRNHSVQYVAAPDYDWYKLRREWPSVYESYADMQLEQWIKVKIEVHGRNAKLFLNGSESPSLVVNGMKGADLRGGIALWGYTGEEAYFSNVRATPAEPGPLTNDGEATGNWAVEFGSDYGKFKGSMDLHRDGAAVKGTWSGDFGNDLPVSGKWRNGYVELSFKGTWPEKQAPAIAVLAGWIDGDSAGGRMKVEGRADGQWTALRKK